MGRASSAARRARAVPPHRPVRRRRQSPAPGPAVAASGGGGEDGVDACDCDIGVGALEFLGLRWSNRPGPARPGTKNRPLNSPARAAEPEGPGRSTRRGFAEVARVCGAVQGAGPSRRRQSLLKRLSRLFRLGVARNGLIAGGAGSSDGAGAAVADGICATGGAEAAGATARREPAAGQPATRPAALHPASVTDPAAVAGRAAPRRHSSALGVLPAAPGPPGRLTPSESNRILRVTLRVTGCSQPRPARRAVPGPRGPAGPGTRRWGGGSRGG